MATVKSSKTYYHHDTKEIAGQLSKGSSYTTSKGAGVYTGRSYSNGKLQFKLNDGTTVYFTAKEWREGNNQAKPDNSRMRRLDSAVTSEYYKAAGHLRQGEVLPDHENPDMPSPKFGEITSSGIRVVLHSGRRLIYENPEQFMQRFQ